MALPFLRTDKTTIVDEAGRPVRLRGVGLGCWLMMEGYMLGGRNIAEHIVKQEFEKRLGREALDDFTRSFRETFIREDDVRRIKEWGASCIRLPFNYRLIQREGGAEDVLNEEGVSYLDRAIDWCEKHDLYCILDMHAAPGSQNHDWHSDSSGESTFFSDPREQERYCRLWGLLAGRYAERSCIAGYDVLNEPIVPISREGDVRTLYERVTKAIREVDARHMLFFEGTEWAQRIEFLGKPWDANSVYSIHTYLPTDFTFNFVPGLSYPVTDARITWEKKDSAAVLDEYCRFRDKQGVPLFDGEFGVQWRGGQFGESRWVGDMVELCNERDIHWTYWTYKTVANYIFPDGIFRYVQDPPWVHRAGAVSGWETFSSLWPTEREKMIESWKTENFTRNDALYDLLKKRFAVPQP